MTNLYESLSNSDESVIKSGVPCPEGVDSDLWSRFQAFEQWNASQKEE